MADIYVTKLANILNKYAQGNSCMILNSKGERLAGCGDFYILNFSQGKWRVRTHECGQFFTDVRFDTEREACIHLLKLTDDDYHLAKYIREFEEAIA